jgi:UPF0755 protein
VRAATSSSAQGRTIAELKPPPIAPQATNGAPRSAMSSKPAGQPSSPDRPDAPRHRIAAGLPPQPPPIGASKLGAAQFGSTKGATIAGSMRGIGELSPTAASLLRATSNPSAAVPASGAVSAGPPASAPAKFDLSKAGTPKSDLTMPDRQKSAKVGLVSATPGGSTSGTPQPVAPGRAVLGAGEPEPPISGRPDGLAALTEPKRIAPRSPRAALEPDHVPLPTRSSRPSRRARNPLVIIGNAVFTLLLLVLIVGGAAAVVGKARFEAPGPLTEDKMVVIPPRSGMMDIADLLKREGVIDEHRLIFVGGVLALKARSELKAGEYLFPKQASVREVLETIVEGKVVQHQLTVPEGLTSEQIVARLLESDVLTGNIKDIPREGSLLPDGYHFNRGFTREQLLKRMQQAQDRLMQEVWPRRNPDLPVKTPEQLIILASIIEKETGKPEERTRIAAVFANRLKQRIKLQSDPTIIYGLVFGKGSLGRPLSRADVAQPTPYNTYVIDGLPPGPISNPGRASIEAAANPARTKELFFVADGTGGHVFAETYDQHLKNVARLRVIEHGGDPAAAAPAPDAQAPSTRVAPATPTAPQRGKRSASGAAKSAGAAQ